MPKLRIPKAGMVSSSGVRLSSRSVPRPTAITSGPDRRRSRICITWTPSARAKERAQAATGTRTSRTGRGAREARGRTICRYSQAAHSRTTAMNTNQTQGGSLNSTTRTRGVPMAAVRNRCIVRHRCGGRSARQPARGEDVLRRVGLLDAAVAALALLEVEDRLEKVAAAEVRPQGAGDPDLRIGDLPEQEVRDPQLARGADEQVGIGLARGVEVAADGLLVDVGPLAGRPVRDDAAAGVHDLA